MASNVYNIEKHVIHLAFQFVLNRKACYTPRFPICIKSKSMLYAQVCKVYKIEKHLIHPVFDTYTLCIACLNFFKRTSSKSNCIIILNKFYKNPKICALKML